MQANSKIRNSQREIRIAHKQRDKFKLAFTDEEREEKMVRPYGDDGRYICLGCAFSTPERALTAQAAIWELLNKCSTGIICDGHDGPFDFMGFMGKEGKA